MSCFQKCVFWIFNTVLCPVPSWHSVISFFHFLFNQGCASASPADILCSGSATSRRLMKSIISENSWHLLQSINFSVKLIGSARLSSGPNGYYPEHRKYMTHPRVQQSILKLLFIKLRVSGALHSRSPVQPLIFGESGSTITATLKSMSLILVAQIL